MSRSAQRRTTGFMMGHVSRVNRAAQLLLMGPAIIAVPGDLWVEQLRSGIVAAVSYEERDGERFATSVRIVSD